MNFFSRQPESGTDVPTLGTFAEAVVTARRTLDRLCVGEGLRDASDDALESAIGLAGRQMQAAYKNGDRDEAQRQRIRLEAALWERSRRPHLVASMESERGLSDA